jgi:hypothetical protein
VISQAGGESPDPMLLAEDIRQFIGTLKQELMDMRSAV